MPNQPRTCPECDRKLTVIHVIDKKGLGTTQHGILEYAVGDTERIRWTGQFPVEGELHGYLCDGCGRVLFYAGIND